MADEDTMFACTSCHSKFTLEKIMHTKDGWLRCPNGHTLSLHIIDDDAGFIGSTEGEA